MVKNIFLKIIALTLFPIAAISIQIHSDVHLVSTAGLWLAEFSILILFTIASFIFFKRENRSKLVVVHLFIFWNLISIFRGIFVAEIYWDWKALVEVGFMLLLPITIYFASNKEVLQFLLGFFIKIVLPIVLLLTVMFPKSLWVLYIYPVIILTLFIPAVKNNWKIIIIAFTILGVSDYAVRSNILKFGMPILILLLYYFRFFIAFDKVIQFAHRLLMIAPWVLLILGVTGVFNVFNFKSYFKSDLVAVSTNREGVQKKQAITDDSRTFIYREVLQSAKKYDYWLLGRTPARGNETVTFAEEGQEVTGRAERLRNEANVPNVFTWTGVIGVLFYFLVFFRASSLAINRSNNIYSKLLGLYVAVRWFSAWIEDYYAFNMNNFVIWLAIGLCFSTSFRMMNNLEVKIWARGIFSSKYVKFLNYLERKVTKKVPHIKKVISFESKAYS